MSKRKSKAAAPAMSACAACRPYFEPADRKWYRKSNPACVYILDEGRRRPCPAGEGCTVRSPMPQGFSSYRRRHRSIIEAFMLARSRSGRDEP